MSEQTVIIEGVFSEAGSDSEADSSTPTRPYPITREVADYILQQDAGWKIDAEELARRLETTTDHRLFSLRVMQVRECLRKENVVLWTDRDGVYRILTEEEKVTHEVTRIDRKIVSAIHLQRTTLAGIDENQLSVAARAKMERQVIRNSYFASANKASRSKTLAEPGGMRKLFDQITSGKASSQ